ncbi:MAG: late competence development ComFB family protein [Peptococcaceae bacterium]|nr:late competence development ComFB family protein [Peptococcaceae bacterium]
MAKSKKDLDKDLLFKKIMPALADNPFTAVSPAGEPPLSSGMEEDPISALRAKIFARSGFQESQDSAVTINLMENLVLQNLDSVIQKFNTCSCDRCRCDIAACALNLLPPLYVVDQPGKLAAREKEVPIKQVMDALVKAVIQVRAHPKH